MKKRYFKSLIIFLLALSLIISSAIGIPMLNSSAQGVSGSDYPTIGCSISSTVAGSSIWAYENNPYTFTGDYPRLITNSNQMKAHFWGYDTTGISNIEIKLLKDISPENISWRNDGGTQEIFCKTYYPANGYDHYCHFTVPSAGKYILTATVTAGNGLKSVDENHFVYGNGNFIGTDFSVRLGSPIGRYTVCTVYDISGVGLDTTNSALYLTKVGSNYEYKVTDLVIQQDPSFSKRYKIIGSVSTNAFSNQRGTYITKFNAFQTNSSIFNSIYYPSFDIY